jgi:DNA-binding transcriptional MerR regulator
MDISIGELSRLTGISVKTIRYYSEIGLVPETGRTSAGYRRYNEAAMARLELVRTLRDLGLDLAAIRSVGDRQISISHVASAHADAIELQIRQLTMRRAVLRALARGRYRHEEVHRMSAFARASADEAGRIMEEFLAAVFADHEDNPFAVRMRAALPMLPKDPSDVQVDAWIELAALVGDPGFRDRVRNMIAEGERQRVASGISDTDKATQRAGAAVVEKAGSAAATGIAPDSPEAAPIVDELVRAFAEAAGRQDDPAYRTQLVSQLETFSDRRVERYWLLTGIINGWPDRPSLMPAYEWLMAALRK